MRCLKTIYSHSYTCLRISDTDKLLLKLELGKEKNLEKMRQAQIELKGNIKQTMRERRAKDRGHSTKMKEAPVRCAVSTWHLTLTYCMQLVEEPHPFIFAQIQLLMLFAEISTCTATSIALKGVIYHAVTLWVRLQSVSTIRWTPTRLWWVRGPVATLSPPRWNALDRPRSRKYWAPEHQCDRILQM